MATKGTKKTSSQPGWRRPWKAIKKGNQAIVDPPVPSPKCHLRPCQKHWPESLSLEPHVHSADNAEKLTQSEAILAATEGLLGLSKAEKTCDSGASQPEDSNKGSDVNGGGVAIDVGNTRGGLRDKMPKIARAEEKAWAKKACELIYKRRATLKGKQSPPNLG